MGTQWLHTLEVSFQLLLLRFNKETLKLTYPSNKCQDSLQSTCTAWSAATAPLSLPARQVPGSMLLRCLLLTSVTGVLLQSNRTSHQLGAKSLPQSWDHPLQRICPVWHWKDSTACGYKERGRRHEGSTVKLPYKSSQGWYRQGNMEIKI